MKYLKTFEGKNTKKVEIYIPNELVLKKLVSTPTFNRLSRLTLNVGKNVEVVNHKQYADMIRLFPLIGVVVKEIS